MGMSGGASSQKKANSSMLVWDESKCNSPIAPCKNSPTKLVVKVIRSDTEEVVPGIKIKANGKSATTNNSGEANFGEVDPDSYTITPDLTNNQKKEFVPRDEVTKSVSQGISLTTTIAIDPVVQLNIVVIDWDTKNNKDIACKDIEWELSKPVKENGVTGGDGLINATIPYDADIASLKLNFSKRKGGVKKAKSAKAKDTDYPIPIQHEDWKDSDKETEKNNQKNLEWSITISDLVDGDNNNGIEARLVNLGFNSDDIPAAIKAYQNVYLGQDNGSGNHADIKTDILQRHDQG